MDRPGWVALGVAAIFCASSAGTYLILRFANSLGLIDVPNARSSHHRPTARGGGGAIAIVLLASFGVLAANGWLNRPQFLTLAGGGCAIAVIGFLDDRWSIPARVRICVHGIAALLAIALLGWIEIPGIGSAAKWLSAAVSIIGVMWYVNLFNFMDGIDGIAASEAIFIALAGAWLNDLHHGQWGISVSLLFLAAANLGFLVWNWPPARIFMGDSGSGLCGFALAALALAASRSSALPLETWLILSGVFVVDATVTLARRIFRGAQWYAAHRSHAYQQLARRFKAHLPATLAVIAVNVFWLLPWAWYAEVAPTNAPFALIAALGPLIVLAVLAGAGAKE
jgi:Fuc2NAc and GlcNAc transferase